MFRTIFWVSLRDIYEIAGSTAADARGAPQHASAFRHLDLGPLVTEFRVGLHCQLIQLLLHVLALPLHLLSLRLHGLELILGFPELTFNKLMCTAVPVVPRLVLR